VESRVWGNLLRVLGFIAAALVPSGIMSDFSFRCVCSPQEKILQRRYAIMQDRFEEMNDSLKSMQLQMHELEKRDNDVYRAIFEANPIPDSIRAKALEMKQEVEFVESLVIKHWLVLFIIR